MIYRRTDEAIELPVEQIAQMLAQAGRSNPVLLSRSQVTSTGRVSERASERRPLMSVEAHLAAAADPYMEQLVSIALASARRAEDALQQASQSGRAAKRSTRLITVLGAIGGLIGIAGLIDHRFNNGPESAAVTGNDQPVAEAQRPAGDRPGGMASLEHAPIDPVGQKDSTAPTPAAGVGVAATPDNIVMARSSAEQFDERLGATTAPTASRVPQVNNVPIGGTTGRAYPTQPYGLNASTSVQPLPSRPYVSTSAQQWPSRTHVSLLPKQYHYIPGRVAASYGSGPSGNPVRDFQRFVTAMGQGFLSIFR
jgi:hypothetical protein